MPALSDPMSEPVGRERSGEVFSGTGTNAADPATSEVSVIEAIEDASTGSRELDGGGEAAPPDDRAPTQVMKVAFSDLGPPDLESGARSLEVRTWRGQAPVRPASDLRSGGSAFAIADTKQTAMRDPTRVDTELEASEHAGVDVDALRNDLEDIERLLRATKAQVAGLNMEAVRGLNAQLTAALHRVVEARSRLR